MTAFYAAAAVCEVCDALLYEGMPCGSLLVSSVNALKGMSEDVSSSLVRFLVNALIFAGYPVEAGDCPVCGKKLSGRMAFDMAGGAFLCAGCGEGAPASESTYLAVRRAMGLNCSVPDDGNKRALRLLNAYFTYQTDKELSALGEYISLI